MTTNDGGSSDCATSHALGLPPAPSPEVIVPYCTSGSNVVDELSESPAPAQQALPTTPTQATPAGLIDPTRGRAMESGRVETPDDLRSGRPEEELLELLSDALRELYVLTSKFRLAEEIIETITVDGRHED